MKEVISKLGLKTKILIFSVLAFILAILTYYWLFVYLEKSTGQFCKTHYCLAIIPTEGYIGIVMAIISLAAVVVSLDSWKVGQKYIENKELIKHAINQLSALNNQVLNCMWFAIGHPDSTPPDYDGLFKNMSACRQELIKNDLEQKLLEKYDTLSMETFGNFCTSEDRMNEDAHQKHERVTSCVSIFSLLICEQIIPSLQKKIQL